MLCQGMPQRWQHELGMGYTMTCLCVHLYGLLSPVPVLQAQNETMLLSSPMPSAVLKWAVEVSVCAALQQQLLEDAFKCHLLCSILAHCLLKPSIVVNCSDCCCCPR
jgi:hypothetical protein